MTMAQSVADMLVDHVMLEYEAIDCMYPNVYVPHLQTVASMLGYLRVQRFQLSLESQLDFNVVRCQSQLALLRQHQRQIADSVLERAVIPLANGQVVCRR
jgi:hypothetical protein